MRNRIATFGDFRCSHCGGLVSSAQLVSGVNNRNHCPYCLWSLHLDLHKAGDRLSACKAPMQPIALTVKRSRDKYGHGHGELMLVHLCCDCNSVSINRIAADDDSSTILDVFSASSMVLASVRNLLQINGVRILEPESLPLVQLQLFGQSTRVPIAQPA